MGAGALAGGHHMKGWLAIGLGVVMMICAAVGANSQTVQTTVDRIIIEFNRAPGPDAAPALTPTPTPSITGGASPRPRSSPTTRPTPPISTPTGQSAAFCPSSCSYGLSSVYQPTATGCQLHFTVPCYPGTCGKDGRTCSNICASNADCGNGATCSSAGECVVSTSTCYDPTTARSPNGTLTSCLPYSCHGGQCRSSCQSQADCWGGTVCNKSTQLCVATK